MLSLSKAAALALALLGTASASPLVSRGTCSPNFEGADLKVNNRADPGWNTPEPAYRVEFTGQWPDTYLIKLSDNHDKVVAAVGEYSGSGLDIVDINFSSSDPLQIWNVRCQSCSSPSPYGQFTRGCTISLVDNNNLCIELDSGSLSLAICNSSPNQEWDFSKA